MEGKARRVQSIPASVAKRTVASLAVGGGLIGVEVMVGERLKLFITVTRFHQGDKVLQQPTVF